MIADTKTKALVAVVACTLFHGSARADSTVNFGYLQVIDANSKMVGPLFENSAVTKIGQYSISVPVSSSGFGVPGSQYEIYYTTTNCKGTQYLDPGSFLSSGIVIGARIYFPLANSEQLAIKSTYIYQFGSGSCNKSSSSFMVSQAGSVLISSLGFTAPFRVRVYNPSP